MDTYLITTKETILLAFSLLVWCISLVSNLFYKVKYYRGLNK